MTLKDYQRLHLLVLPFFLCILAYGIGFLAFASTGQIGSSSLYMAMLGMNHNLPVLWGALCILTVALGLLGLLEDTQTVGRIAAFLGFSLWLYATFCWFLTGGILLIFAIGIPNLIFWIWLYFNIS